MKLLTERLAYIFAEHPELEGLHGQTGLMKASGATKSVVNQWLSSGIKTMNIRYAMEIERNLGYSHLWLMRGEGEPKLAAAPAALPDSMRLKCEDLEEYEILSMWRLANPTERGAFKGAVQSVADRISAAGHQAKTVAPIGKKRL